MYESYRFHTVGKISKMKEMKICLSSRVYIKMRIQQWLSKTKKITNGWIGTGEFIQVVCVLIYFRWLCVCINNSKIYISLNFFFSSSCVYLTSYS